MRFIQKAISIIISFLLPKGFSKNKPLLAFLFGLIVVLPIIHAISAGVNYLSPNEEKVSIYSLRHHWLKVHNHLIDLGLTHYQLTPYKPISGLDTLQQTGMFLACLQTHDMKANWEHKTISVIGSATFLAPKNGLGPTYQFDILSIPIESVYRYYGTYDFEYVFSKFPSQEKNYSKPKPPAEWNNITLPTKKQASQTLIDPITQNYKYYSGYSPYYFEFDNSKSNHNSLCDDVNYSNVGNRVGASHPFRLYSNEEMENSIRQFRYKSGFQTLEEYKREQQLKHFQKSLRKTVDAYLNMRGVKGI